MRKILASGAFVFNFCSSVSILPLALILQHVRVGDLNA